MWPAASEDPERAALGWASAVLNGTLYASALLPRAPVLGGCQALAAWVDTLDQAVAHLQHGREPAAARAGALLEFHRALLEKKVVVWRDCQVESELEDALDAAWGRLYRVGLLEQDNPRTIHMCHCAFPFNFRRELPMLRRGIQELADPITGAFAFHDHEPLVSVDQCVTCPPTLRFAAGAGRRAHAGRRQFPAAEVRRVPERLVA